MNQITPNTQKKKPLVTIDVTAAPAETSTALVTVPQFQQLTLFEQPALPMQTSTSLIPVALSDAAHLAGLQIFLDFNKFVRPIEDGVLITKQSTAAQWFYRLNTESADAVILSTSTALFTIDGTSRRTKFALCFFGYDLDTFKRHFEPFGNFYPTKKFWQKKIRLED